MKEKQVEEFRKMVAQLGALHQEMTAAAKKGADKPINAFKVKLINTVLAQANSVLGEARPQLGFDAFDDVKNGSKRGKNRNGKSPPSFFVTDE